MGLWRFSQPSLAAILIEEYQCGNRYADCGNTPSDSPIQGSTGLIVGGALLELDISLKFAEGEQGRQHEKNHAAEHEDDDAIGQLAAGAGSTVKKQKNAIGAESKAADKICERGKNADDANDQPSLPAHELRE